MVSARARIRAACVQALQFDSLSEPFDRTDRRLAESVDQRHARRQAGRVRVERLQPRLIIVRSIAQPLLEDALQFAETAVAERLGEAHESRRLHGGLLGNAADRSKRNIIGKLNSIGCDLRQPLGHRVALLDDEVAKLAELVRRVVEQCVRHRLSSHLSEPKIRVGLGSQAWRPHPLVASSRAEIRRLRLNALLRAVALRSFPADDAPPARLRRPRLAPARRRSFCQSLKTSAALRYPRYSTGDPRPRRGETRMSSSNSSERIRLPLSKPPQSYS